MLGRLFKNLKPGTSQKVPATYDPSLHYNCFVETVPAQDRQAVYQELRRIGSIQYSHVLPDGRLQLSVRNLSAALKAYNAVAKNKVFAAGLSTARLIELMVSNPNMEVTALMNTRDPRVGHAERIRLAEIVVPSESAFRRGVDCHMQKQYQRAIQSYDEAIGIEPQDVRAWHNKILALAQLGQPQAALEVVEKALAFYNDVGILWEVKGKILTDMGKLFEAGDCMSKACKINPTIAKRHEKAIDQKADKWFQSLMEECRSQGGNPETDVSFWWAKFAAYTNSGDAEKTFLCLQMAATIGPEYSILSSSGRMLLLPPGHPLLDKELLPVDAKVERVRDFFQRITNMANRKKV